ncbi:MAG: sulfatase [Deltaproteobacteria bacterium]|jgi:arylsulfatase A-like enzyme|nr:sulfatase [Deltaproteobacteria bacterium]
MISIRPAGAARAVCWVAICATLVAAGCGPTAAANAPAPPPTAAPGDGASSSRSSAPPIGEAPDGARAAGAASPQPPAPPPKLNVLLVTVDAMRADMPWNGYPRDIAPRLTALERQSVSYLHAYAISSYTAMSVGGFLSGRYPSEMQRSGYFFSAYPDSEVMFPELLRQAGVRTLAAHAHFYFENKAGFHQGFDEWRIVEGLDKNNKTDKNVSSPQHLALAIEMLSNPANTAGQFFAWFHFMDPHDVYVRHDGVPDFGRRARDRYDGEIYFTDRHVGKLLDFVDAQPWGKHTVVIINSDHGEAFGEHKRTRHGFEIWEPLVRVPLIFKIPGVAPRRIAKPRGMIDVAPTIFELMGIEPDPRWQGKSLVTEMKGEVPSAERDVVVDLPRTSDNDRRRALIYGRHKLISFGDDFRFKLFDLESDPEERRDLRKVDPELYDRMRQRYDERSKTIRDICPKMRHKLMGKHKSREC